MIKTQTFTEKGKAFVWSKQTGEKVVVIIDDGYKYVNAPNPYPPRAADGVGLYTIFKFINDWDEIKGCGFFNLPEYEEQIVSNLYPNVSDWLKEIGYEENKIYFLIDMYYGNGGTEIGMDVYKKLRSYFPRAKFAHLSRSGAATINTNRRINTGDENAESVIIELFEKDEIEEYVRKYTALPNDLLRWLDHIREAKASSWDVKFWKRIRQEARIACNELGNPKLAHHLPYGGDRDDAALDEKCKKWKDRISEKLSAVTCEIEEFPSYGWLEDHPNEIPVWEQPPIRALAQIDRGGQDLTSALFLLKNSIRNDLLSKNIHIKSNILSKKECLQNDYLWFNVSALANGLYILAKNFIGEIAKYRDPNRKDYVLKAPYHSARIFWDLEESNTSNLGLSIRIYQCILMWNSKDHEGTLLKMGHPLEETPQDSMIAVYDYFEKCGSKRIHNADGSITLNISAEQISENGETFWEVKENQA